VYGLSVSRRRLRRRTEKERRHAHAPTTLGSPPAILREAIEVDRFAYTRTQAAEALGVSRSTFDRRVLPLLETVEMPWGTTLIPVDELERLLAERRRPALGRPRPGVPGRRAVVPAEVVDQIRAERVGGKSFARIASDLNAKGIPTAHGGSQWWPSTVRAVFRRSGSATPPLPVRRLT
jgi:Recombinase